MADAKRKPSDGLACGAASCVDRLDAADARSLTPQKMQKSRCARYFVSDENGGDGEHSDGDDSSSSSKELTPPSVFEHTLQFQYKGDVFAQRGLYADAVLYMSRLPSTRKAAALRPKPSGSAKLPAKLAPMAPPEREAQQKSSEKAQRSGKKRQYVLAVEAMAANPALHANLLRDSVVPNVVALCRTKDVATLASCVATLCHLSCEPAGRQAILIHNALGVLLHVVANVAHERRIVAHALAVLANVTIEDACESAFVKDKALESMVQSRKVAGELADATVSFAVFNLSCPAYSYPRVEDVIRALAELGRDARERELLIRALYNFSCTKANQLKVVESQEAMALLRACIARGALEIVRRNAFAALYHLSDNALCRRALVRADCVHALVRELPQLAGDDELATCALLTLLRLSVEPAARESMGRAQALDALDALNQRSAVRAPALQLLIYELIAVILSDPRNIASVSESFLRFLLAFAHSRESARSRLSCYVLFALTCILSWSEQDDASAGAVIQRDASTGALFTARSSSSGGAITAPPPSLEELLDEPQHLEIVFRHVAHDGFDAASPELYLQVLLLYNLSFRYSKVDVAMLAAPRLTALARASRDERVLSLLCGVFFNLCQEYAVHVLFSSSSSSITDVGDGGGNGGASLDVLERFARFCDDDAKCMSLEVVCIVFDGRRLPSSELVALAGTLFPVLAEICARGGAAIRAGCAACFARFAMLDACRVPMVQSGLVASLALLVSDDDPQTLRLCVHAYSYLCRNAAVCATLIRGGIIKALTYLAAAPEEAVRRACAVTLCNISASDDNINALVRAGALRALLVIACVKSTDPETRRICMKAVMNLLRHGGNIAQMCQDGLLWAFGLFVGGMEPKDFDILADAFCALAFYPATRAGASKAPTLARMLEVLSSAAAPLATKTKVLRGVSNLLSDAANASLLLGAGVLPHLVHLVGDACCDGELKALATQLLVLLFQSASELETPAFADTATLRAVTAIMRSDREDCSRTCCLLLLRMSAHAQTRRALVDANALAALPSLFVQASKKAQTHLVRCLYNVSCDAELLPALAATDVLPYVAMAAHNHAYAREVAVLSAGLLRNASTESAWHASLVTETVTALIRELFDAGDAQCREDAGICASNLFLGRSNTHELLARALLPPVLALCGHTASEHRALSSAVLRKLALAPGNAEMIVTGGALTPLAALLREPSASLGVKKNCVAVFCLLSQRADVPRVLGAAGIISAVLELLDANAHAQDPLFETMCVDLLSALAEFARADDPREGRIASILYELMDKNDCTGRGDGAAAAGVAASATWQSDRSFLSRAPAVAGGQLPLSTLSTTHAIAPSALPTLQATLFPLLARGYSVELNLVASHVDTHTIEALIPDYWSLLESFSSSGDGDSSGSGDGSQPRKHSQRSASAAFVPPAMFEKSRAPFTPDAVETQWPSRSATATPMTPSKKVPPLRRRDVDRVHEALE